MIVDDNPSNLQVLGLTLKNENYQVEFATNGRSALEWIKNRKFDLILLDINMPEMNGFEVCSEIRSNKDYNNIPIIFLTAEIGKENVLKGFEIGAQDFITKPFDSRELLARVRTHLEIKYSREQLQILNQQLEEKVQERTVRLRQAHEELKETHQELKETHEKLMKLDQAKTEFLRLISHEIRTPLNGIVGPVQLIKDRVDLKDFGTLLEILDISVKRLERLSYNALIITRLRTRMDKIHKTKLPLKKLVQEGLEELSGSLSEKKIKIKFSEMHEDLYVEGEYELLKTCLVNILDNSVTFSPVGGVIRINMLSRGSKILCEISDNGQGFAEEVLTSPFVLFAPLKSGTDNKLGLGLYMSKLIMDAHSGTIEVGNTKKGGAEVRLSFIQNAILS